MLRGIILLFFGSFLFSCSKNSSESKSQVAKILPIAPSNLKATSLSITEINLTWIDNSTNEDGFKIERKDGTSDFKVIATTGIDKTEYKDSLLTPYIQYVYRAYSFNTLGKSLTYTNIDSAATYGVPLVTTKQIDSVTSIDAVSGGQINYNGGAPILEKGIIWNKNNIPSLNLTSKTKNNSDTINYKSVLYSLEPNTTYYLWAYATNKFGTAFGNMITFKTTPFIYNEVMSKTGKIWMDRNLGATQIASRINDDRAYGYLYQWGRFTDGHQFRTSLSTNIRSNNDIVGNQNFIITTNEPYDWRSPSNNSLWQGASGINNPCPIGFRLPTSDEWEAEIKTWDIFTSEGAFNSVLKLPSAGSRNSINSEINQSGFSGSYWGSSINSYNKNDQSYAIFFGNNGFSSFAQRSSGYCVRCIKN